MPCDAQQIFHNAYEVDWMRAGTLIVHESSRTWSCHGWFKALPMLQCCSNCYGSMDDPSQDQLNNKN